MSLYQHNIQNAEKKAVWLSVRYAFNQFKFNSNEQRTSSKTRITISVYITTCKAIYICYKYIA